MLVTNTIQMYIEELFKNGNTIEICKFLENEYADKYLSYNENFHEKLEKILLDLNNNLINAYLVHYCLAQNTYYYLLKIDNTLITNAIFNLHMMDTYDNRLIEYLVKEDNSVFLIKKFFSEYMKNHELSIGLKPSYIDALIEKKDSFSKLPNIQYIKILQYVLSNPIIHDIIQKEIEDHDNWMTNRTEIQKNIWLLICRLDVNTETIRLLSGMSENITINSFFSKDISLIREQLEKWSFYNYTQPKDNYDYISNGDDSNDKIQIQMLICSYARYSSDLKDLEFDGAIAYRFRYEAWFHYFSSNDGSNHDYIRFLETHGQKLNGTYENKMFKYFELNTSNYQEEYFKTFRQYCTPNSELVLRYFEEIGSAIVDYDEYDINNILEKNNLNNENVEYYLRLYKQEKNKNDLITKINKLPQIEDLVLLKDKLVDSENKSNKERLWLYILLLSIFLQQMFFR